MTDVAETGAACGRFLQRAIARAVVLRDGPPAAHRAAVHEAGMLFAALVEPLEAWARHQRVAQRLAETSTTLEMLRADLARLGAPVPSTPVPPAVATDALQAARSPVSPAAELPEGPLTVTLVRLRPTPLAEPFAEVRVAGPDRPAVTLAVWAPTAWCGPWHLSGARPRVHPRGIAFDAPAGTLSLDGLPVVIAAAPPPAPAPPLLLPPARDATAEAVIALVNERVRWDYEVDPHDGAGTLALRGTSGFYEPGCLVVCTGVSAAHLPHRFSHATFRRLSADHLPPALRPEDASAVILGIGADTDTPSAAPLFVVARALRFEEAGQPNLTFVAGP